MYVVLDGGRRHPTHRLEALMVVLVCSSSFGCTELDNESENDHSTRLENIYTFIYLVEKHVILIISV